MDFFTRQSERSSPQREKSKSWQRRIWIVYHLQTNCKDLSHTHLFSFN